MSYSTNKQGEITISGFEQGIGPSPYKGHQMIQNLNVTYEPGGVYLNIKRDTSAYAVSGPTNQPTYIVQDQRFPAVLYAVDLGGVVWQSINVGATWSIVASSPTTNAHGNGIAVWNGYLLVARDAKIDAIAASNTGTTGGWTTLNVDANGTSVTFSASSQYTNHFALIANDTKLYFCNGTKIADLVQVTGKTFDPTDASTFIYNDAALSLPFQYYNNTTATSMCELGNQLLVAAGNYVYPWDKNSPSYNVPIPFTEPIYKIYNVNNLVYCFAGIDPSNNAKSGVNYMATGRGNIYLYNGYQSSLYKKIPDMSGSYTSGDAQNWLFGGVAQYYKKLLFGLRGQGSYNAIYSIDTETGVLVAEYEDSQGQGLGTGITTAICVTYGLTGTNIQSFSSGWSDESGQYGFAITNGSLNPYTTSTIITDLIPVGTFLKPKTFEQIELKFAQPLSSGETISLSMRSSLAESFSNAVLANGFISAGTEGVSYLYTNVTEQYQWLQFQVNLGGVSSGSRCQLTEIIIR